MYSELYLCSVFSCSVINIETMSMGGGGVALSPHSRNNIMQIILSINLLNDIYKDIMKNR